MKNAVGGNKHCRDPTRPDAGDAGRSISGTDDQRTRTSIVMTPEAQRFGGRERGREREPTRGAANEPASGPNATSGAQSRRDTAQTRTSTNSERTHATIAIKMHTSHSKRWKRGHRQGQRQSPRLRTATTPSGRLQGRPGYFPMAVTAQAAKD